MIGAGISYIVLGITNLYLYKREYKYVFLLTGRSLIITGIIIFILSIVNFFVNSKWILMTSVLCVLINTCYLLKCQKDILNSIHLMDKLSKKH